jgi:glutathione-regulated potassium-efflux system protein KefB
LAGELRCGYASNGGFCLAKLYLRAFDRGHVLRLIEAGVDYQIRETFESAMAFGEAVLVGLGVEEETAAETIADVRRRDAARLDMQVTGGIEAGKTLIRGNTATPEPAPLTTPGRGRPRAERGGGRRSRTRAERG